MKVSCTSCMNIVDDAYCEECLDSHIDAAQSGGELNRWISRHKNDLTLMEMLLLERVAYSMANPGQFFVAP